MLTPVIFLPLAAVLINDVRTEAVNGALTIDIATSDPVATSDVRVSAGGARRLYVYLDGSAARLPSFGDGPSTVVVYPRLRYTKLEIPTAERCGEPIGVVRTDTGVRVRATCRDGAAAAATVAAPVHVGPTLNANHPLPEAPLAALGRDKKSNASLRAALALPEGAADEGVADGAPRAVVAPQARAKATEAEALKVNPPERGAPAGNENPVVVQAVPPRAETPDAPAVAVASSENVSASSKSPGPEQTSGTSVVGTVLAALLLLGIGVVATLLARRRGKRERMIRIVETASIGPRRSLVVACVGGRTMVLGVSEAGVSLLDTQSPVVGADVGVAAAAAAAVASVSEPRPSGAVEDAALGLRNLAFAAGFAAENNASEVKSEGSLLGRLFHRKPRDTEGLASDDFEALFSESLEDEDLRRKLAMGESGRVA